MAVAERVFQNKCGQKRKFDFKFRYEHELKPFLKEIEVIMRDLHHAFQMFDLEMQELGFTEEERIQRIKFEFRRLIQKLVQEEKEGLIR